MIAGLAAGVGDGVVGVDQAGHGKSVERLGIEHSVATGEGAFSFGHLVGSPEEDLVDDVEREFIGGDGHDVHRGDRLASHGVDVGEGVGGRDLSEEVGIIDDRREEIEGLHNRELFRDFINGGVVRAGGTDKEIGVGDIGDTTQDLREFGLAELGGSSSAGG